MIFFKIVIFVLYFGNVFAVENSGSLFSELFKTITGALIASGANGPTRQSAYPSESGISASVYNALQTITKNDDLECVPRLLCEAIAGGKPGGSRQINIDKYSLSKLISYLQLDALSASPMLTFGKAAVLGLSNRGDPYSCIVNYPKCPRDETRLLYYLNNHRGGFFRFFDMKQPHQNYQYGQNSYYTQYPTYQTNKPGQYYYARKPSQYLLKGKEKSPYGDTYAKKYSHQVSFPGKDGDYDSRTKVAFPQGDPSGEPRIQTKVVGFDYNKVRSEPFVFSNSQRYGKKLKDSSFFPHYLNTITGQSHFVSDRLPSKFHFPGNDGYHMKFPEDTPNDTQFFPRN